MTETLQEIHEAIETMKATGTGDGYSKNGNGYIYTKLSDGIPLAEVHFHPFGVCGTPDLRITATAPTFKEACEDCTRQWLAHKTTHELDRVKDMALKIIELTFRNNECCESALRGEGFTHDEVKKLGSRASTMAGDMADGAPFIILTSNSNQ
ncbi:MAG: hypothetical protein JKY52_08530 [Flavobacteriales bacterium]|nr:hypothetical protein [Flavobacteriales bacterium]